jgi:uncharacterized membrane protein YkvA (DUF1232 family)
MPCAGFNQSALEERVTKIFDDGIFDPDDEDRKHRLQKDFWSTLKKAVPYIPFAHELVAAYFCAMDPHTPARVRVILLGALAYFVMPFDLIPDFLVAFGFSDDAAVLMAAITAVRSSITPAHYKAAQDALKDNSIHA